MPHPRYDKPFRVFISYARPDDRFREELVQHLAALNASGEIIILQDRDIRAGSNWQKNIVALLDEADIVLLLISPLFFHSNFCIAVELKRALERVEAQEVLLVPVLVRPVDWQATAVSSFQALPEGGIPVSKWSDRDDAYVSIASGLRKAIEDLRKIRSDATGDILEGTHLPAPDAQSSRMETAAPLLTESASDAKPQIVTSDHSEMYYCDAVPVVLPEPDRIKQAQSGALLLPGHGAASPIASPGAAVVAQKTTLRPSTYDFTHPATVFFRGRTQELNRLSAAIQGGKSAAIFGLQRVGKTSLVERAIELTTTNPADSPIIVRIDMFSQWESFKSILDFFNVIASELAKAEGKEVMSLQRLLNEAYGSSFSEYHLQDTFRGILRKSKKITGRPIVVFIDEFQEVERAFERAANRGIPMSFDSGVIRWLGSLIKDRDNILQVVLCCRFQAKDLEQRERMELFKLLELIDIGPLDESAARSLIRDPVADSVHYDEESVKRMLELTGRFPYFVQYVGYELLTRQRVIRTHQVRRRDIDECADEIVSAQINEAKFSVLYEDFKKLDGGQPWKVILCLAHVAKSERQLVSFSDVAAECRDRAGMKDLGHLRDILRLLALTQLIIEEKRGPEPSYCFGPELLRRWLQQQGHTRALR